MIKKPSRKKVNTRSQTSVKSRTHLAKEKKGFFASCPVGLEDLLEAELKSLKVKEIKKTRGGVHFGGSSKDFLRPILYSRLANRIYKKLYSFRVRDERELYKTLFEIKWKAIFNLDQTFKVDCVLRRLPGEEENPHFKNSLYLAQLTKDAIVDRFRKDFDGQRPNVEKKNAHANLLLYIEPDDKNPGLFRQASVLLDLCGVSLDHRYYRKETTEAPLRENLAAGIIQMTGWNPEKEHFLDSMCGSGTFLAEALLMKGRIPPSYLRVLNFKEKGEMAWAFLELNFFAKDKYARERFGDLVKEVHEKFQSGLKLLKKSRFRVSGNDANPAVLMSCRQNLEAAHLLQFVELTNKDAQTLTPSARPPGVVVCNPPYGERMGEKDNLKKLYHDYGENLKFNFKGYRAYVLTSDPELRKAISLQTKRRIPVFNGPLECRLLEYHLY